MMLTLISLVTFAVTTEPSIIDPTASNTNLLISFFFIECFAVWFYFVDYMLRLVTCTSSLYYKHYGAIFGRLRFIFSFGSLLDLSTTAPSFVALILVCQKIYTSGFISGSHYQDTATLSIWRVVRLVRIFRLSESVATIRTIAKVFYKRSADLLTAFLLMFFIVITCSVVLYYTEKDAQPESFSSVLQSIYFSIICLFTIGFGDVIPITPAGKFVTVVFVVIAFAMFSIPTSIFNAAFLDQMNEQRQQAKKAQKQVQERHKERRRRELEKLQKRKQELKMIIKKKLIEQDSNKISSQNVLQEVGDKSSAWVTTLVGLQQQAKAEEAEVSHPNAVLFDTSKLSNQEYTSPTRLRSTVLNRQNSAGGTNPSDDLDSSFVPQPKRIMRSRTIARTSPHTESPPIYPPASPTISISSGLCTKCPHCNKNITININTS
ncbi:potassium voltage-gated channel subfamily KQT member [Acrasis kona]|uniref:Potassium voltage-gated channel subfamily KQT member n=1 Tax=Acrasis kona TaxID=1008807 RepID=A0AAW2ZB01_9EUKA